MSVIIRLQNLPWSANALDIRTFFRGLSIPDGGVHIVGGEMGDAFIAFSTDEDARQAMMLDRGKLNEVQIRLLLSSRAEMQKVIEQARQQSLAMMQIASKQPSAVTPQQTVVPQQTPKPLSAPQPPIITSTSLQNILSQKITAQKSFNENSTHSYQSIIQPLSDNSMDSRESRDQTKLNDRDREYSKSRGDREKDRYGRSPRSRSKSRDRDRRRSSRSRSRDRTSGRRRSHRSRTRSPDSRRSNRRRRSRDRSRDRDRQQHSSSNKNSRERSPSYSRERDRGRDYDRDSTDKKSSLFGKNVKDESNKSSKLGENANKTEVSSKMNRWESMTPAKQEQPINQQEQPPQTPQAPVFTTNYGQGYNANQIQIQSLFSTLQQMSSNSMPHLQQQLQQPNQQQHQFQQQFTSQNTESPILQNQQQPQKQPSTTDVGIFNVFANKPTEPLNFHNFLNSNLGSFNYSLLSANNNKETNNDLKAEDDVLKIATAAAAVNTFQNPYTIMDQNKASSSFLPSTATTGNMLGGGHNMNFSGIFGNKNPNENNMMFDQNNEFRKFEFSSSSYPPTANTMQQESIQQDRYRSSELRHQQNKMNQNSDTKVSSNVGHCIRISNMCPGITYSDVRRFFSGLFIANNGIKMINDENGYRVGTAYIRFVRQDSKTKAFLRNHEPLRGKPIFIENVSESEFEEAIDSFKPKNNRWNNRSTAEDDDKDHGSNDDRRSSHQRHHQSFQNERRTSAVTTTPTEFSALLLEGIPGFATEQDVMKMFSLYTVIDIILTRQDSGIKQFIAYVKFHRAEDAKKALADKTTHAIGHKQIFVTPCSDEDFEKAKAFLHMGDGDNANDNVEEEEQVKAFVGQDEAGEGEGHDEEGEDQQGEVMMDIDDRNEDENHENDQIKKESSDDKKDDNVNDDDESNDGDGNGPEVVADGGSDASKIPSLLTMSLSPIIPTDPRQRNRSNRFNQFENNSPSSAASSSSSSSSTKFVFMKNCDYKATKIDILHFFGKINLTPLRIEFLKNNRGQNNGELIVEFGNFHDAEKSLENHNTLCMNRRIRLEIVSSNFVANRLGDDYIKQSSNNGDQNANHFGSNLQKPGLDLKNNSSFMINTNSNSDLSSMKDSDGNNRQRPSRFSDLNENSNSQNMYENRSNNRRDRLGGGGGNYDGEGRNGSYNNYRGGGNEGNRHNNRGPPPIIGNTVVDQFGQPGCVVGLENVPYKAGTDDIIEFFQAFNIQPHQVIRRYNDNGTATGDARVAFASPMDAQQAIKMRNKQKIFDRTIFLNLV